MMVGSRLVESSMTIFAFLHFQGTRHVKRTFRLMLVVFSMFVGLHLQLMASLAADKPPPVGGTLPEIKLPAPQSPEEGIYLGITGKSTFTIPQVRARIVIVEIFSMYCPFCQKEAPMVNVLYRLIDSNRTLKDKIKIIGIGAGNSPFEVNTFKKKYEIGFPLFPDADFAIHETLGQVRTPYFIAIRVKDNGTHKVLYSELGTIGDPQRFLETLLKEADRD